MVKVRGILFYLMFLSVCFGDESSDSAMQHLLEKNVRHGAADVVFLLDRSGSVGHANFEIMKAFVESLLMHVVVDANATRVAVISYSDTAKLHINYISMPRSKCFFAQEMQDVKYEEVGSTDISSALNEARMVLQEARQNVNKVVILISDGISNHGMDPVPIARQLKEETQAEFFAFGIGKFLLTQLRNMATSPAHVYSCPGFREFKHLARIIRGDPHESKWSDQASETPSCDHLCNSPYRGEPNDPGCCDHHALCSCALLSGTHTCVCKPGYFGLSGTWGKCTACPKGTYKSRMEPSSSCDECPAHSTTSYSASRSLKDCFCKEGYHGKPSDGVPCEAMQCPPLQNPTHGFIVGICKNQFSATCHFMCEDGYELVDSNAGELTCGSNGRWSSNMPVCQRIRCSQPLLKLGIVRCSQRDLFVGATCDFSCFPGLILKGSPSRRCLPSKQWSDLEVSCVPVTCPIPRALIHGYIRNCEPTEKPTYGTNCFFRCGGGFRLIGPPVVQCDENGNLVDLYTKSKYSEQIPYCKDMQPPVIKCPAPITIATSPGSPFAVLQLEKPSAFDNDGMPPIVTSHPPVTESFVKFGIGRTSVIYQATDASGLVAECTHTIEVYDKEAPIVVNCPKDIIVNTSDIQTIVYWEEPEFQDNSQILHGVKSNLKPGSPFNIGKHQVTYYAMDQSGNHAICTFQIIVTQIECPYFPPPVNGALACEEWMHGEFCQAYCEDKYDFVSIPAEWYVCNDEANWVTIPEYYPIPWPDCTGKKLPYEVRKLLRGYYYSGNCNDPRVQYAIKKAFLYHFRQKFPKEKYCQTADSCIMEKIKVKCGAKEPAVPFSRSKRSIVQQTDIQELDIELDIFIDNTNASITEESLNDFFNSFETFTWDVDDDLHQELAELDQEADKVNSVFDDVGNSLKITSSKIQILCPKGSILKEHVCMLCPPGTFHDLDCDKCMDCPTGYYQEEEGQLNCLPCPANTTTATANAKNNTDCKGICREGTYSTNGLETCLACPRGSFQDKVGESSCISCPNGTTTISPASSSIRDCQTPCGLGTYSIFGFEPCKPCAIGFYQNLTGQLMCEECPTNFTTLNPGSQAAEECIEYDHCLNGSICENGGTCITVNHDVLCQCQTGFMGKNCEVDVDECENSPCSNGSTCLNLNGSFSCICSLGYEGELCDLETDECEAQPCLNNGTCVDQYGSYLCICSGTYSGENCEKNLLCSNSILCLNGGYCSNATDKDNAFCICPDGFTGLDCSTNISKCQTSVCQNGGSCIETAYQFHCTCALGYTGSFCEAKIDECAHNECYAGATCIDQVGSYQCLCPPDWGGRLCDKRLSSDFIMSYPDEPSLSNMATSSLNFPLEDGTLSMWVQTRDIHGRSNTPLSYAAFAKAESNGEMSSANATVVIDNALTVTDCSDLTVYINNNPIYIGTNISDGNWHHLGFTWTSNDGGKWQFYKDGQLESSGTGLHRDLNVPAGGTVVIGQEQDRIGGGFSLIESFSGNITRLNIWNKYFQNQTIANLCKLEDDIPGKVVAWVNFRGTISGDVQLLDNMIPMS